MPRASEEHDLRLRIGATEGFQCRKSKDKIAKRIRTNYCDFTYMRYFLTVRTKHRLARLVKYEQVHSKNTIKAGYVIHIGTKIRTVKTASLTTSRIFMHPSCMLLPG